MLPSRSTRSYTLYPYPRYFRLRLAGTPPTFQRDGAASLGHAHDSLLLSKSHSSRGSLALRLSSRPSEQREREPGSIDGPGAGPSPRIFDWGPVKSAKDNMKWSKMGPRPERVTALGPGSRSQIGRAHV